MDDGMNTQEKILYFGKQEFLQKGFQNASLRDIASAAGMTTGAIYTYFKDKNALFETIVDPVYQRVDEMSTELSAAYYTADCLAGETSSPNTAVDLHGVYDFVYANFDIFRLLVVGAEGSSRAGFVHTLVDHAVAHTLAYLKEMKVGKRLSAKSGQTIIHLVSESYINALLEPVRHNMSYEDAIENLDFLATFYTGGWQNVFCGLFCDRERVCRNSLLREQ